MRKFALIALLGLEFSHAMTLEQSIALALANSTQLERLEYQEALHADKQSAAAQARYGSFDLSVQLEKHNLPRTLSPLTPSTISPNIASTTEPMSIGVNYSVLLFSGYAEQSEIDMEELAQKSVTSLRKLTKEQIVFNVKSLYFSALATQKKEEAQSEFVLWLEDFASLSQEELALGRRSELDILRITSTLAAQKAQLEALKARSQTLLVTLQSYTQEPIETLEEVGMKAYERALIGDIATLERLQSFDTQSDIIAQRVRKQESRFYPKVSLNAYYGQNFGYNDSTNPQSGDFEHQEIWHVNFKLGYNLFDFGAKDAASQALQKEMLQTGTHKEEARRSLVLELATIEAKAESLQAQKEAKEEEERLLDKSVAIESLRLEHGAVSMSDFLELKAKHALVVASIIELEYEQMKLSAQQEYVLEKGVKSEN
jgi:outer membrane protein TolC